MISNAQSDNKSLDCGLKIILRVSLRWSTDASLSKWKDPQHRRATSLAYLLTVHYLFHVLEKAMDDLEGLCCRYPSLVLAESVYPLEYRLDILLSKELLEKFFCVAPS